MTNGTALRIVTAASVGLLALAALDLRALAKPNHAVQKGTFEYGARVQKPQKFLTRRSYVLKGGSLDLRKQQHAKRWLIEKYGNIGDEETAKINAKEAHASAKGVNFFGMPISVHAKIAPALLAVEKRILKSCPRTQKYTPPAIGGFRTQNTYRGVEISNHLLGIAIDIDPEKNPCCGCVDPWPTNPVCKNQGPVFKRTALPKCWIQAFERFGFDWLGHDSLEDTMHFEFLGDPDKVTK